MPIIAYFPGDVQSYLALKHWRPPLPESCPLCRAWAPMVGHGSYSRYVGEEEPWLRLRIPRLRCRACGRTFGVLPSFLVPHRHYSAGLIQRVLGLRHQLGFSRRQLSVRFQGVPALSTCLAWLRSFGAGAQLWLSAVLTALAHFDPSFDPLHRLLSPTGRAHGPPRLLLELLPQLLVALGVGEPRPEVGITQGLGLLLLWGQGHPLPRLI